MSPNPNPSTQYTEQVIANLSFHKDLQVLTVEMVGFDGANLTRVSVASDGTLNIA